MPRGLLTHITYFTIYELHCAIYYSFVLWAGHNSSGLKNGNHKRMCEQGKCLFPCFAFSYDHAGHQSRRFLKARNRSTVWPSYDNPEDTSKRHCILLQRRFPIHVHWFSIHNSSKMEIALMAINWTMDNEIPLSILLSYKEKLNCYMLMEKTWKN